MSRVKKKAPVRVAPSISRPRAVLYARVSTAEQEREGFSVPAQLKLLREYAEANGIAVSSEHIDVETAKRVGRPGFNSMLSFLRKHPSVRHILVEKTDRLYRNLKDWVTLDTLDVETHLVKENVVLSRDSRSSEKFMHGIKVLMAKNYIDNLSEETRKGMIEKAEQGIWPSYAPIGYSNVMGPTGKRIIAVDPELGPKVTKLFEWFETGQYSIRELVKKAQHAGMHYRKSGRPLGGSTINGMLRNRLYTGSFEWLGKVYEGTHTPLTTFATWTNVQEILDGRSISNLYQNKHSFAFTGLITCGHCGCSVTAEIKRGKYVYYHCSRFKGRCSEPYVREEVLDAKFAAILRRVHVDDEVFGLVRRALKETAATERRERDERIGALRGEADRLLGRLDGLYLDKLEGRITSEFHDRVSHQWREERDRILRDMESLNVAEDCLVDDGIALIDIARNAYEGFPRQPLAIKKRALNLLLSNTSYQNGELTFEFRQPFEMLAELPETGDKKSTQAGLSKSASNRLAPRA